MSIKFYGKYGKYACFSNFYECSILIDEQVWPTVEHYFQAQKFLDVFYKEKIRGVDTPREARQLGRSRDYPLRPDWEDVKVSIMERAIIEKFKQHSDLLLILINTEGESLIENSPTDYFWGCGATGKGQNMLGKLLGKVRDELLFTIKDKIITEFVKEHPLEFNYEGEYPSLFEIIKLKRELDSPYCSVAKEECK